VSLRVVLLVPFGIAANRGNSTAAHRLAAGLRDEGAEVTVASVADHGIAFGPAGVPAARAGLGPALAAFRPDVLHAFHGSRTGPIGVALAGDLGCALVVGLRGTDVSVDLGVPSLREPMLDALERADAVVAFADFMLDGVRAARPALARVAAIVPHGVADRFFAATDGGTPHPVRDAVPPGGVLFILPANLRAIKAPDLAVLGLDAVAASRPGVRLAVAGPTLEPDVGTRLADAVASRPWARLLGEVPHADMPALLASADVVLNTSVAEGMSNAVIEAMACARALLLSDIPAHRAIAEPEREALLFDVSRADAATGALARHAARLADDAALRARLGAAARARARLRHTVVEEARRTLEVYAGAMARRAART
jgi:glycosyltransferase involved in cell wall biosynthesis